ncbi:hypothetical protein BZG35_05030 [Brevundimonas sp. LM2]|uniref:hypothetical protein n=1 Tax=Brevundimonas sp. LM2 TaxID=1938605 RepID=UPI0009839CF0|nr:hypothetical protein [Brevundimonas sp. LM2]AQR61096.1 hypothetical protein BZG35_05030 [Brevundimonas sp. LM2]
MDDASPIAAKDPILEAAVQELDAGDGFATLDYQGREIILMTAEKFEQWEDAVDLARIQDSILNPDPEPRLTLEQIREKYDIPAPVK